MWQHTCPARVLSPTVRPYSTPQLEQCTLIWAPDRPGSGPKSTESQRQGHPRHRRSRRISKRKTRGARSPRWSDGWAGCCRLSLKKRSAKPPSAVLFGDFPIGRFLGVCVGCFAARDTLMAWFCVYSCEYSTECIAPKSPQKAHLNPKFCRCPPFLVSPCYTLLRSIRLRPTARILHQMIPLPTIPPLSPASRNISCLPRVPVSYPGAYYTTPQPQWSILQEGWALAIVAAEANSPPLGHGGAF